MPSLNFLSEELSWLPPFVSDPLGWPPLDPLELPLANVVGAAKVLAVVPLLLNGNAMLIRLPRLRGDDPIDRVEGASDRERAACHGVAATGSRARFAKEALADKRHAHGTRRSDCVVAAVREPKEIPHHSAVGEDTA